MPLRRDLRQANRLTWNAATAAHESHKRDQGAFLAAGGSTLFPEELELLEPLEGRTLLHLQCNAGQDTLSLAALGAEVTGVDISDTAIAAARAHAAEAGLPAGFHRADVYDWLERASQARLSFDRVFSSYGAIYWLSDIDAWARGIARVLAPGGRLVLVEFHPVLGALDEDWNLACAHGPEQPLTSPEGVSDYVAESGPALAPSGYVEGRTGYVEGRTGPRNPHKAHEWAWGLGHVVQAVIDCGLTLTALREYPWSNGWRGLADMVELPGGRLAPPQRFAALPLMFGLAAENL